MPTPALSGIIASTENLKGGVGHLSHIPEQPGISWNTILSWCLLSMCRMQGLPSSLCHHQEPPLGLKVQLGECLNCHQPLCPRRWHHTRQGCSSLSMCKVPCLSTTTAQRTFGTVTSSLILFFHGTRTSNNDCTLVCLFWISLSFFHWTLSW